MSPFHLKYLIGWCHNFCISLFCSAGLFLGYHRHQSSFPSLHLVSLKQQCCVFWVLFRPPHLFWNSVLVYVDSYWPWNWKSLIIIFMCHLFAPPQSPHLWRSPQNIEYCALWILWVVETFETFHVQRSQTAHLYFNLHPWSNVLCL